MKKYSDSKMDIIDKLGRFLDKYWKPAFCVFWFVLVMVCFFIWGYIEVNAAGEQDYFPMHQNKNGKFSQAVLDKIDQRFDSENNYIFVKWDSYTYNRNNCYVLWFPKNSNTMIYGEKNNDLTNFSLYYSNGTFPSNQIRKIEIPNNASYINEYTGFNLGVFSGASSNYSANVDYVSNFKVWTSNNEQTRKLVLNYGYLEPDYYFPGSAIAPSLIPPVYPPNMPQPSQVPSFRPWNSYTWNTYTPPSIDSSTLESLVESLIDIVKYNAQYIADGVGGAINNLGSNIKNLFEDLGDIIKYYGDVISKNLQDFADNIYDNFKELLEPLNNVVQLFVKPWDADEFQQQLGESAFYGSLDSTMTSIRTFGTSLTRASEPQDLSFTINLTAIGWGISEISFNWIKPFRTVIRLIIGCVLVYWLVITVITEINNIIGSGGDSEQ